MRNANQARQCIDAVNRGSIDGRDGYYRVAEPHYKQLEEIAERFDVAEPVIQERSRTQEQQERQDTRRFIIQTLLTIVGMLIAGTGAYFTIR